MFNILTVDVEDWFMDLDPSTWENYESHIISSTSKVLKCIGKTEATFFVLGKVAEDYPELVQEIYNSGHEIGTHGYDHQSIYNLSKQKFKNDLGKSIRLIEDITNEKVNGHRASYFSICDSTAWAIDVMEDLELDYDSSIFPVKTHLYGVPNAPLAPYKTSSSNINGKNGGKLWELPLAALSTPLGRLPVAGGFYLRFFPYQLTKFAIKRINKMGLPAVIYLHPWEFDYDRSRHPELPWYQYYRLRSMEGKFKQLLKDFKFISASRWLNEYR